jgi:choline kinase
MKAIILAAGRGSRMKGATETRPKCLVELAGRPLLDLQFTALRQGGVDGINIVTGYRADMLADRGARTFHNARWAETNMVASLMQAAPLLQSEVCVISYADIFYPPETIRRLATAPFDIAISYDPDWLTLWSARFEDPLSDAETFRLAPDGRVIEIGGKTTRLTDIQGQYMGLLKFTPTGWSSISTHLASLTPEIVDRLDMTSLLSRLIAVGIAIHAVPTAPGWGEVDSETDLAYFTGMLERGEITLP